MKICALYKCFSGEEWLKPSVLSILRHVDKIVLLTSDVSWIGGNGNPSLEAIDEIIKLHGGNGKIIHINHDEPNQLKHCMYGYNYIKQHFPDHEWVQLIDSDELWDDENYIKAKDFLRKNPDFPAYRTQMYTYIKSPLFRIDPPEPLKPVCFIKNGLHDMGNEPRGCTIKPFTTMTDVYYHHMVFVRMHFNKVLEKLIQSHVSEKQPYESMDKWIVEVWNKLPHVPPSWTNQRGGFHPAIGFGRNWKNIKIINKSELPRCLHNSQMPIARKFGL